MHLHQAFVSPFVWVFEPRHLGVQPGIQSSTEHFRHRRYFTTDTGRVALLTRLGSCIFCTCVDQILGVIPQSYGSTPHCSVGSGVEGPSHHDWVRRMPSHPDPIYRLTHAWEAVKGHFLTLCSLDFLHRLVSCQECADNSEMLISGTICMKRSPNGFVPARGFLESGMAPRPSFNDSSNPKDIVVIDDDGTEVSHRSLRTPISTYQKHVRYAVFEFQELLDSSSISSGSYISE